MPSAPSTSGRRMPTSASARLRQSRIRSSGKESSRSVSDRKSTRLNSSHSQISYAAFSLNKKRIHIAFDQYREFLPPHSLLRAVHVIEHVALGIDRRLGRIEILRHLVAQRARSERHDFS